MVSMIFCVSRVRSMRPCWQLQAENDASVDAVMKVIESDGWEHVTTKSGITVVKKFLPATEATVDLARRSTVVDAEKAAKFACVKAMGTLDAEASELYKLFLDNERVHVSLSPSLQPIV